MRLVRSQIDWLKRAPRDSLGERFGAQLQGYRPRYLAESGRLDHAVGSFGMVFRLDAADGTASYACKVFERIDGDEVVRRYQAIERTIGALTPRPRLLETVRVIPQGIHFKEAWAPVVLMPWIDGKTLHAHVRDLYDVGATKSFAEPFDNLRYAVEFIAGMIELDDAGIAQGDLCPRNLIVRASDGELRLVDYDNMCVPELAGQSRVSEGSAIAVLSDECGGGPGVHSAVDDRQAALLILQQMLFLNLRRRKEFGDD